MKSFILILCLSLSTPSMAFADAKVLRKGDVAPFDGVLLDHDSERAARVGVQERDAYKALFESQNKVVDIYKQNEAIYEQRISNLNAQNDKLAKETQAAVTASGWEKFLYFAAGAVVTGAIAVGLGRAIQ
jgi:hypothetical protein